jgi:hypothetical protein
MVSGILDYVIYLGWGIHITKCKQEFEFPWKSNVVLGSCGLKDFEKKKEDQWTHERDIRAIWPLRNLKLLFDQKGSDLDGCMIELGSHMVMSTGDFENVYTIQNMCALCSNCHVP